MPKQKANLKNIPKYESKKPKKKRRFWKFCLIFLIIFLVFVFLIIPSLVAATGIVKVPLLSRILYHSKKPDFSFSDRDNVKRIGLTVEDLEVEDKESAKAKITEEELNSYLQNEVMNDREGMEFIKDFFILLHDGELEIWASIEKSIIQTDVNLKAELEIRKGKPHIELKKVKIGAISVPGKYLDGIEEQIDPELEKSFAEDENITLQKISIKEKVIIITGKIRNPPRESEL